MNAVKANHYTKSDVLTALNDWFGVDEYEDVIQSVENGTRRANFGNYKQVPIVSEDKFGRIGLREFFEDADHSGESLTMTELEELLGESEWELKLEDNTYNYSGSAECDMDYKVIESAEDNTVIAFFSIHVGLDARAGYTKSVAFKYDGEYDFICHLGQRINIAYAEFTQDGKKLTISADGEVASEYYSVWISDESNGCIDESYEEETTSLDMYDKEDFVESVATFLTDNNIQYDTDSIKVIN